MNEPAVLALDQRCALGEGLLWDGAGRRWLWTDIESSRLHVWAGSQDIVRTLTLPDRLGSFALARSGRLLLGLAKGLAWARFDGDAGIKVTPLLPVEADEPRTRINDGRTDRSGNFVFGTYNQASDRCAIGSFYQYSTTHGLRRLALPAVHIANAICFSPDGTTMYFCDTAQRRIMQCRYDAAAAEVSAVRLFVEVDEPGAAPDGAVIDSEGCLWNAQWGGSRVQRYSPQGERLQAIALPVPQVTCPAFGGDGLRQLMITTARQALSAEQLARSPTSGGLFHCADCGATGLADALFAD